MTKDEALKLALNLFQKLSYNEGYDDEIGETIAAIKEALEQPEQEPFCYVNVNAQGDVTRTVKRKDSWCKTPLYATPPQRKPQFKEFIKWAGAQGYDCAQTCNSDTGEWIVLNPMTADLWKAWQAAYGIKE